MATSDANKVKQIIKSLLEIMNIGEIYIIDDYIDENITPQSLIGYIHNDLQYYRDNLKDLLPQINFEAPPNVWSSDITSQWNRFSLEKKKGIGEVIIGKEKLLNNDFSIFSRLVSLFPRNNKPKIVPPSEWQEIKNDLFTKASEENRIFCFFDQDISKDPNFIHPNFQGIDFIKEIIELNRYNDVICCLLTNTIPNINGEMERWRKLATENQLQLYQFLPLAKCRLDDSKSPLLFSDGVKKAILNQICENWKIIAEKMILSCSKEALTQVSNVDVYDFDHIIFKKSYDEGVLEIDSLLRLYTIFFQDLFRKSILDPINSENGKVLIEKSRQISNISIPEVEINDIDKIISIRRKEFFEQEETVLYTPIELGDIFINLLTKQQYILLAQPCDLMMRNNGKRTIKGLGAILLPFISVADTMKLDEHAFHTHVLQKNYYNNNYEKMKICFKNAESISTEILDLAVFDPNGYCKIILDQEHITIPQLTDGWNNRYNELFKHYSERANQIEKVDKFLKENLSEEKFKNIISMSDIKNNSYSNHTFDYKFQRIGRYRQPYAERMLKRYSDFLSRYAEDYDFAELVRT